MKPLRQVHSYSTTDRSIENATVFCLSTTSTGGRIPHSEDRFTDSLEVWKEGSEVVSVTDSQIANEIASEVVR